MRANVVDELRETIGRGVHAHVERRVGAQTERTGRGRRRSKSGVAIAALSMTKRRARGVQRDLGAIERQRPERSAVDARVGAQIEMRDNAREPPRRPTPAR